KTRIDGQNAQLEADLLKFAIVINIPLAVFDYPEWKKLVKNVDACLISTTLCHIRDILIPQEVGHVRTVQIKELWMCENLTITFDGNTTRAPESESVYTIHVITVDRVVYVFEGNKASDESHTGHHLFQILDNLRPSQFTGIGSDDTGNTCVAHEKVQKEYPWILNMADPCHHLNNLTKDICNLPHFKGIIKDVHRTVKFFKKSTIANSHLKKAHRVHMILCGTASTVTFEMNLQQFFSVTKPLAKSITCLESSHATMADVYVFWLAIMASMNYTLQSDIGLPNDVAKNIGHLCNYHFNQSIHDGPSDIFITSFFLDPCFQNSNVLKGINPLTINMLRISGASGF
ncbi:hypothetical protein BDN71DRAFT_1563862, partial [Pleurotus eryngii]